MTRLAALGTVHRRRNSAAEFPREGFRGQLSLALHPLLHFSREQLESFDDQRVGQPLLNFFLQSFRGGVSGFQVFVRADDVFQLVPPVLFHGLLAQIERPGYRVTAERNGSPTRHRLVFGPGFMQLRVGGTQFRREQILIRRVRQFPAHFLEGVVFQAGRRHAVHHDLLDGLQHDIARLQRLPPLVASQNLARPLVELPVRLGDLGHVRVRPAVKFVRGQELLLVEDVADCVRGAPPPGADERADLLYFQLGDHSFFFAALREVPVHRLRYRGQRLRQRQVRHCRHLVQHREHDEMEQVHAARYPIEMPIRFEVRAELQAATLRFLPGCCEDGAAGRSLLFLLVALLPSPPVVVADGTDEDVD
mmetsp:Transcript_27079/g.68276  ORF Transcript_27079/g.68276 Transcript_27079/m.68276 type:complete len:363 (-) Transcript_27079:153-1241(-)